MRRRRSLLAAAVLIGAALAAPRAARAGDPYLEDPHAHEGLLVGAAIGGGGVLGLGHVDGMEHQLGGGGAAILRLGSSAGEHLAWMVQIDSVQILKDVKDSKTNNITTFTVAGQYYLRDALWLMGGVGTASLNSESLDAMGMKQTTKKGGMGFMSGVGLDITQHGSWVLAAEVSTMLGVYSDGVVGGLAFRLSATHY